MKLVGVLLFGDSQINYYSKDSRTFFMDNQKKRKMGEEYLSELALWVNSPKNRESQEYCIVQDVQGFWICKYSVESLGSVKTVLYGYGVSELDALNHCKATWAYLQENYNVKNNAIKE